jgi:hypothetical protein
MAMLDGAKLPPPLFNSTDTGKHWVFGRQPFDFVLESSPEENDLFAPTQFIDRLEDLVPAEFRKQDDDLLQPQGLPRA